MTSTRKRILFFANGIPPFEGMENLGPDQRADQVLRGLRKMGHDVVLSLDLKHISREIRAKMPAEYTCHDYSQISKENIFSQVKPDVVYFGAFSSHGELWTPPVPTIVELAGPMLIESSFIDRDLNNVFGRFQGEINAINKADLLVAFGERQKWYYFTEMLFAGFDISQPPPITYWRNGFNPELVIERSTSTKGIEGPRLLYTGGIFHWLDPVPIISAAVEAIQRHGKGYLTLITPRQNLLGVSADKYDKIMALINRIPRNSQRMDTMPYPQFVRELANHDVALELFPTNFERALAVPYRTAQMLGAGIPVITSSESELGELIQEADAGWAGKADNKLWLNQTFESIFLKTDEIETKSLNARQLCIEKLSIFSGNLEIESFLANPPPPRKRSDHTFSNSSFWLSPPEKKLVKFLRKRPFVILRKFASKLLS